MKAAKIDKKTEAVNLVDNLFTPKAELNDEYRTEAQKVCQR